jgi:signal transduction histidine kinase
MIRTVVAAMLGTTVFAATPRPAAADKAAETQALVERAADHIRQHGRQRAFADFNRSDGGFVHDGLYAFCNDGNGVQLANGGNPQLVGKNLSGLRDNDGKPTTLDIFHLAQTQGQGWYDYLWPNPSTAHVERKFTYVLRIDDQTVCAGGYFRAEPP